jgi:AcrR family transcriptional regulator
MAGMVRAAPLPPDERRATIIAATEPLLLSQGREVSTREIAEAAGIAEGTIFRVFTSKDALIEAVFADAFDQHAGLEELARIDRSLDLETRVTEVVDVLQRRVRRIFALVHALGYHRVQPGERRGERPRDDRTLTTAAIAAVLEPDRDRLQIPPERVAATLTALVMAMTHPILAAVDADVDPPRPRQIAHLLLYGVVGAPLVKPEGLAC